jgi:hypothetical protein
MNDRAPLQSLILVLLLLCAPVGVSMAQTRDHLTEQEVEIVKEAQALDKRIEVFIKAADRRMLVLSGTAADANNAKQQKKDSEQWGPLPQGTRTELIGDIAKIFDEAITNIDDVSARDEKNPLLAKSLRNLAKAATRIVGQLKPQEENPKDDSELNSFDQLVENAESIIQAANKLAPATDKKEKGKAEKTN